MNKGLVYYSSQKETSQNALEIERISVSGIEPNSVQHSSMFYQPFSEELCKKICRIFENYMISTAASSRTTAMVGLQRLTDHSNEEIPNIECLLYASRVANSRIINDSVMFDALSDIAATCYELGGETSFDAVRHIFENWNWECQAGLALVGAIKAERNSVKREQLLSEMDKYIKNRKDVYHQLLLFKTKAMVARGNEYSFKIFEILINLHNSIKYDPQIAGVIKQESSKIFKGNETIIDNAKAAKNVLANSTIKDIKQSLGFYSVDDEENKIKIGNDDQEIRKYIASKMANDNVNVERYCGIIRKGKLNNYLPVFEDLLINKRLNIHNKCCIALTYSQMIRGQNIRFNNMLEKAYFPDDFTHLLKYVFNSSRTFIDYDNLDYSTDKYFDDDCSALLKKGIKHSNKYDPEVSNAIVQSFSYLLGKTGVNTPYMVLEKFADLLKDQKSKIFNLISKSTTFIQYFEEYLTDNTINLDTRAEFFDSMIEIIKNCPKTAVKNMDIKIYNKTNDPRRKERARKMMGNPDVIE